MTLVTLLALAIGSLLAAPSVWAQSPETPRRGGVPLAAIGADAPSLDPHQDRPSPPSAGRSASTGTLLQIDPTATRTSSATWPASGRFRPTALTYTFRDPPGIRFHDARR